MQHIPERVRDESGRESWLFPDGTRVSVVSGGADDDEPKPKDESKPKDEPRKPWGSDDDFDPDKAWRLIQNLKSDLGKSKSDSDELKSKLDELADKDKTEVERLTAKLADAEKARDDATRRADRLEVALDKGLTKVQARRLVGSTVEELEADAEELVASFKPADDEEDTGKGGGEGPTRRPTEDLRGGGDPTREPSPDMREVVSSIPRDV